MDNYIVRQPIKDMSQNVMGYEIVFESDSGSLYNQENDKNIADTIANFLLQNSSKVFDDKIVFLTFTPNLLFRNIPQIFKPDHLVVQISDNMILHPFAKNILHRYREQGYGIALNEFEFSPRYFSILDIIDYIRLNPKDSDVQNILGIAKGLNKKTIAYDVNDKDSYDLSIQYGFDFMEGSYIAKSVTDKAQSMDYLKSNFFQLVVEITKDDPDLNVVESIISRDVSLTYSLLKLVNSAYFALRNKAASIMQALVILGLGQLKQWIYLLSFKQDDSSLPEELIKISLLRANFCSELLARAADMPISKSEAYLMGMFSTLEHIVHAPLEETLSELNTSETIKEALLHQTGRCGLLYQLVLCYETADWKAISNLSTELSIPQDCISQIYFECVENVNTMWNDLMSTYQVSGLTDSLKPEILQRGDKK